MKLDPLDIADRDPRHLLLGARTKFEDLKQAMKQFGHPIFLAEGYRTPERQDWLFAQGRSRPGPVVTHAHSGQSWHETRRAFDVAFIPRNREDSPYAEDHPWDMLGKLGRELLLEWGGDWKRPDRPHFQWCAGLTVAEAIEDARQVRGIG